MLQARTTADTWRAHPAYGRAPVLGLTVGGQAATRLVVVSAHPDDESLGAGGLIATAAAAGLSVYVVLLTAGEASPYAAKSADRHAMATLRLAEMENALVRLAPDSFLVFLGAPDGQVAACRTPRPRRSSPTSARCAPQPSSPAARPRCTDACSRTTRVPTSTT